MTWYRITVNDDGKVLSCRSVEKARRDSANVFYVQAENPKAAGRAAFNAYYRDRVRKQRDRYAAEGKCRCGRERDTREFRRCSECRRLGAEANFRSRRRSKGESVPEPDKAETYRKRRDTESNDLRLAVLLEVQKAWVSSSTNGQFARWLGEQINALSGKAVA